MRNVIALDTASPQPAVALLASGKLFEERLSAQRRVSEELLPALARCLAAAGIALRDCDRIAVCSGPGSFTGVRIGLATAWGLRRALGIPLETVSTLEAMAEAARAAAGAQVATALDAGRGEVVLVRFALEGPRAEAFGAPIRVGLAEAARLASGWDLFALPPGLLGSSKSLPESPCRGLARAVGKAPRGDAGARPEAIYSRPSAAEEKRGAS